MPILDRVRRLISANIHDLLDRAEDPEKMLDQLLREMRSALQQAKSEVAKSIADEKRLSEKQHAAEAEAEQWEERAARAVGQGDDSLAKQALARRNAHQRQAEALEQAVQGQRGAVEELKEQVGRLEFRLEEAEGQRDVLVARAQSAKAKAHAAKALAFLEEHEAFGRLEDGVSELEARAEVPLESALETEMEELEEDEQLAADLAELKERLADESAD